MPWATSKPGCATSATAVPPVRAQHRARPFRLWVVLGELVLRRRGRQPRRHA
ncbi:hypothetical protein [Streptomyces sp. NPDC058623]|uniref:hypothetical protein n=1 Tax=Streptomyces sp. NPDC058623 TaxID=3346563 RepID=UPI0036470A7F